MPVVGEIDKTGSVGAAIGVADKGRDHKDGLYLVVSLGIALTCTHNARPFGAWMKRPPLPGTDTEIRL